MMRSAFCTPSLLSGRFRPRSLRTTSPHRGVRWVCTVASNDEKRIVFLGTPEVAATTLEKLIARAPDAGARIVGVVTRPPSAKGRSRTVSVSPVHQTAMDCGISPDDIYTPKAVRGNEPFLATLEEDVRPDLFVTAAYGCILPQKFLDIATHGTLNIHPSLLPRWRGAAPVPRSLEAGDTQTGVSVAWTVLALDAGPILAQRSYTPHKSDTAPIVLSKLFDMGTDLLLDSLPAIWSGSASQDSSPLQDPASVSHAAKLSKPEARLTFVENAVHVHNKVRAYHGWPGTWADFTITITADNSNSKNNNNNSVNELRMKVISTEVLRESGGMCLGVHDVSFDDVRQCLRVTCDDGSVIGVHEVQPAGKKVMSARAFWNGMRNKKLGRKRVPH